MPVPMVVVLLVGGGDKAGHHGTGVLRNPLKKEDDTDTHSCTCCYSGSWNPALKVLLSWK